MLIALAAAIVIAHFTRFGADVYAIGGDRTSAKLMGVPMRRTTIAIYALGGFYSALGGVIYALYTSSGYPLAGTGNELSAIAAVVLGGTVLTGGVGMVAGTLFGGMILGLIATLINFNGSLNGAWIMISGGVMLFLFIVMQRSLLSSFRLRGALENCSRTMARASKHLIAAAGRAERRDRAAQRFERNIHTSLAGRLGREIVDGIYPPGSLLPNAADMCARFSVSRTVLREAYSVLTAKAMIVARPKIGTRVRPMADWNMLDPEVLSWHLQTTPTENFVAELFVLRQMVEPEAAALAAKARSRATIDRIAEAYRRMDQFKDGAGDLIGADLDFHMGILDATGNHFLTALGGLIRTSLECTFELSWRAPRGSRTTACISTGGSSRPSATARRSWPRSA